MKKLLSIVYIILIIFSAGIFVSCGDPYKDVKLEVFYNENKVNTSNDLEYFLGSNANDTFDISVKVANLKKEKATVTFYTKNSTTAFEPKLSNVNGNTTTLNVQALARGSGRLYARLKETNIEVEIPIKIIKKVAAIFPNDNYQTAVKIGASYELETKNLISYFPTETNQREVKYELVNIPSVNSDKITLTNSNKINVASNYILNENTKKVVVKATSIYNNAISTTFEVNIIENLTAEDFNAKYISNDSIVGTSIEMVRFDSKFGSTTVEIAANSIYPIDFNDFLTIETVTDNYTIAKVEPAGYAANGNPKYKISTVTQTGSTNVKFIIRFAKFANIPAITKSIRVNVIDMPSEILINGKRDINGDIFDVYTQYFNNVKGLALKVSLTPNNLDEKNKKVYLSFGNNGAVSNTQLAQLISVKLANETPINYNNGYYEIPYNNNFYITVNSTAGTIPNNINMQVWAYKDLASFENIAISNADREKVVANVSLQVKYGIKEIHAYKNDTATGADLLDTTQNGTYTIVSTNIYTNKIVLNNVFFKFDPVEIYQNNKMKITSSNTNIVRFYKTSESTGSDIYDEINGLDLIKADGLYKIQIVGLEKGTATITFTSDNGVVYSFRVEVVVPTDNVSVPIDKNIAARNNYRVLRATSNIPSDIAVEQGDTATLEIFGQYTSSNIDITAISSKNKNAVGVSISKNIIYVTGLREGSSEVTFGVNTYDENGTLQSQQITIFVHSIIPVGGFTLSNYSNIIYSNVNYYHAEKGKFDLSLVFNKNATKNVILSNGEVFDIYRFEIAINNYNAFDFNHSTGIYYDTSGLHISASDYNFTFVSNNNTESTIAPITFNLYKYGSSEVFSSQRCDVSIIESKKVDKILLNGVQTLNGANLIEIDIRKSLSKSFTYTISNENATFKDIKYFVYRSYIDANGIVNQTEDDTIKVSVSNNTFKIDIDKNKDGGQFLLKIVPQDCFTGIKTFNKNKAVDIVIRVADGKFEAFGIEDESDLFGIGSAMDKKYVLRKDIYLNSNSLNIGAGVPFTGSLSGKLELFADEKIYSQQYIITCKNTISTILRETNTDGSLNIYSGLFAKNEGVISDIHLIYTSEFSIEFDNATLTNAYISAIAGINYGKLENIFVNITSQNNSFNIKNGTAINNIYFGTVAAVNYGIILSDTKMINGEIEAEILRDRSNTQLINNTKLYAGSITGLNAATAYSVSSITGNYISKYSGTDTAFTAVGYELEANTTASTNIEIYSDNIEVVVYAGGIAGANNGNIANVCFTGSVANTGMYNTISATGGLIGANIGTSNIAATLSFSVMMNAVVEGAYNVGGAVGYSRYGILQVVGVEFLKKNTGSINYNISGYSNVAGLIGNSSNDVLSYTYVESFNNVEQVIGDNNVNTSIDILLKDDGVTELLPSVIGGLVGLGQNFNIANSYIKANLTSLEPASEYTDIGGIVGCGKGNISMSYFIGNIFGLNTDDGLNIIISDEQAVIGEGYDGSVVEYSYSIAGVYTYASYSNGVFGELAVFDNESYKTIFGYEEIFAYTSGNLSQLGYIVDNLNLVVRDRANVTWYKNVDYNNDYPVQVLNVNNTLYVFAIRIPKNLTVSIKMQADNKIFKKEYGVSGDNVNDVLLGYAIENNVAVLFYNKVASGAVTNINSFKITDLLNILLDGDGGYYVSIKSDKNNATLIDNKTGIKLLGVGKVVLTITSAYNSELNKQINLYITNGISSYQLFNTADTSSSDNLLGMGKNLTLKTNSETLFTNVFANNGYDSIAAEYMVVDFSADNYFYIPFRFNDTTLPLSHVANEMLIVTTGDLAGYDYSRITSNVTAKPYMDLGKIKEFNNELSGKKLYLKDLNIEFKLTVAKVATKIISGSSSGEMVSGFYVETDITIETDFYNQARLNALYTSGFGRLINSETDEQTDELKIAVSVKQGYINAYNSKFAGLDPAQIFDISFGSVDITEGKIKYSDIRIRLKENYREIKENIVFDFLMYASSNPSACKNYQVTVIPQPIDKIRMIHYADADARTQSNGLTRLDIKNETTYGVIEPGRSGLLKVTIDPYFADVDYFTVQSSIVSGKIVLLQQMVKVGDSFISLSNPAGNIQNGIQLKKVSNYDGAAYSYDGAIYVRTLVDNVLATELMFDLTFGSYKNNVETPIKVETTSVITKYLPKITLSLAEGGYKTVEINSNTYILVEAGQNVDIGLFVTGYEFTGRPSISLSSTDNATISDSGEWTRNQQNVYVSMATLFVKANAGVGSMFTVNSQIQVSRNGIITNDAASLHFIVADNIVNANNVYFENVQDGQLLLPLGVSTPVALNWGKTGAQNDAITNILINAVCSEQEKANNDYSKYLALFYEKKNTVNGIIQEPLKETMPSGSIYSVRKNLVEGKFSSYSLVAKAQSTNSELGFSIYYYYAYDNGQVKLVFSTTPQDVPVLYSINFTFKFIVYYESTEEMPIAITSANEFMINLVEAPNEDYILMNDITLENYEPIVANFKSFDGNNKIIRVKSFTPSSPDVSSVAYVGLFKNIAANTLVKNVTLDLSGLYDLDLSIYNDYVVGMFAAENNGLITNCEVVSLRTKNENEKTKNINVITANIINSNTSRIVSMFVGVNRGNISNSRVGTTYFEKIDIEKISSNIINERRTIYYSNTMLLSTKGNVAGFVGNNSKNIGSCYVYNLTINNTTANVANDKTAGFVVNNYGNIYYSYVKSSGLITSVKPRLNYNAITSYGDVAGFVSNNTGLIGDCYANIKVYSLNKYTAGFVSKNDVSGRIERSYSATEILSNAPNMMPFTGVNDRNELQDFSLNGIKDCYYLDNETDSFYAEEKKDKAYGMVTYSFQNENSLNNFTFISSNVTQDANNAIWTYKAVGEQNYTVQSAGVLPELTSPNIVAKSIRFISEQATDSDGNIISTTFEYVNGYEPGTRNNPYIIRSAIEFNSVFASASSSQLPKVVVNDYVRQIADIDFADTGYEVKTREKIVFAGNYDGNGMAIKNITITAETLSGVDTSIGLFSRIQKQSQINAPTPVFKNVNLNFTSISGSYVTYVGGLAGVIESAYILNVNLYGDNIVVYAKAYGGGLAGMIKGNSQIVNVSSNLSVSVGNSSYAYAQSGSGRYYPIVNSYYNYSDYLRVVKAGGTINEYNTYLDSLSYAGGLAGVIDIQTQMSVTTTSDLTMPNLKLITVNTGNTTGNNSGLLVKVIADHAGGVAGYLGKFSFMNRVNYNINITAELKPDDQYINGAFMAGGLVGENHGKITVSQVAGELDAQTALDRRIGTYLNGGTSNINFGNTNVLRSNYFAGGLIGFNYGGYVMHAYTKMSLLDTKAEFIGGVVGGNIGGAFNSVYAANMIKLPNTTTKFTGGFAGRVYDYVSTNESASLYSMYNYLVKNYTILNNIISIENNPAKIGLNKVVAATGYKTEELAAYKASTLKNAGSFVGYSSLPTTGFMSVADEVTMHYNGTNPTLLYTNNDGAEILGDINGVSFFGSVLDNSDDYRLTNGLSPFSLKTLTNTNLVPDVIIAQQTVFDTLFSKWSRTYWSQDNTYLYPLLLKQGFGNVIEIDSADDFYLFNENPTASFVIINDIEAYDYNDCVVTIPFEGKLTGYYKDKPELQGISPTVKLGFVTNSGSTGADLAFFKELKGANISNLKFEYGKFNLVYSTTPLRTGNIGGLAALDSEASTITDITITLPSTNGLESAPSGYGLPNTIGGLVGEGYSTSISNCLITGNISAKNANNVGGLVGAMTNNISVEQVTCTYCNHINTIIPNDHDQKCQCGFSLEDEKSAYNLLGVIRNSKFTGNISNILTDTVSSSVNIGGLVGSISGCEIYNCKFENENNGILSPTSITYTSGRAQFIYVGAITGNATNANISSCSIYTNIKAVIAQGHSTNGTTEYIGFVAGQLDAGSIKNCEIKDINTFVFENVSSGYAGNSLYFGGLIGNALNAVEISNCDNWANIGVGTAITAGKKYTGNVFLGGLFGCGQGVIVEQCFTKSNIVFNSPQSTANIYAGGIGGQAGAAQVGDILEQPTSIKDSASFSLINIMNVDTTVNKSLYVGGLVGHIITARIIEDTKNVGILSVQTGGQIYISKNIKYIYAGGITGRINTGTIAEALTTTYFEINPAINLQDENIHINPIAGYADNDNVTVRNAVYSSDFMCLVDGGSIKYGTNLSSVDLLAMADITNPYYGVKTALLGNKTSAKLAVNTALSSDINAATWLSGGLTKDNQVQKYTIPYLKTLRVQIESMFVEGNQLMPKIIGSSTTTTEINYNAFEGKEYCVLKGDVRYIQNTYLDNTNPFGTKLIGAGNTIYLNHTLLKNIPAGAAIINCKFKSPDAAGTAVKNSVIANVNNGNVFACGIDELIVSSYMTGAGNEVGYLAGTNNGKISYSYNAAVIYDQNSVSQLIAKAGLVYKNTGKIEFSYFTGSIVRSGGSSAGFVYENTGNIFNCYSAGTIENSAAAVDIKTNSGNIVNFATDFYANNRTNKNSSTIFVSTRELFEHKSEGRVSWMANSWTSFAYSSDSSSQMTMVNYGYPIPTLNIKSYTEITGVGELRFLEKACGKTTGDGTKDDPILISNIGVLDYTRSLYNISPNIIGYYKLVNNITVASSSSEYILTKTWNSEAPTGQNPSYYGEKGKIFMANIKGLAKVGFNGQIDTNKYLTITRLSGGSFINLVSTGAIIKEINFVESGEYNDDVIASGVVANESSGEISNIVIGKSATDTSITKANAGIVGTLNGGNIFDCNLYGAFTSSSNFGGIVLNMKGGSVYDNTITASSMTLKSSNKSIGLIVNNTSATTEKKIYQNTVSVSDIITKGGEIGGGIANVDEIVKIYKNTINLRKISNSTNSASFGGLVNTSSKYFEAYDNTINFNYFGGFTDQTLKIVSKFGGLIADMEDGYLNNNTITGGTNNYGITENTVITIDNDDSIVGVLVGDLKKGELGVNIVYPFEIRNKAIKESSATGLIAGKITSEFGDLSIKQPTLAGSDTFKITGVYNVGGLVGNYNFEYDYTKEEEYDLFDKAAYDGSENEIAAKKSFSRVVVTGAVNTGGIFGSYTVYNPNISGWTNNSKVVADAGLKPVVLDIGGLFGNMVFISTDQILNIKDCTSNNIIVLKDNSDVNGTFEYIGGLTGRVSSVGESSRKTPKINDINNINIVVPSGASGLIIAEDLNGNSKDSINAQCVGGVIGDLQVTPTGARETYSSDITDITVGDTDDITKIMGHSYVGGVFGRLIVGSGSSADSIININKISVKGKTSTDSRIISEKIAGGIIGYIKNDFAILNLGESQATEINNNLEIYAAKGDGDYIGGIVGSVEIGGSGSINFKQIKNTGKVTTEQTVSHGDYIGGIAGSVNIETTAANNKTMFFGGLTNTSNAAVKGMRDYVGGIFGRYNIVKTTSSTTFNTLNNAANINIDLPKGNYIGGIFGALNVGASESTTATLDVAGPTAIVGLTNSGSVYGLNQVGGIAGSVTSGLYTDTVNGNKIISNFKTGNITVQEAGLISGLSNVGGVFGRTYGISLGDSNIEVSGKTIKGEQFIGGVAGVMNYIEKDNVVYGSHIEVDVVGGKDIICTARIEGKTKQDNVYLGGIVGRSYGYISDVTSAAIIENVEGNHIGGIVGKLETSAIPEVIILRSTFAGTIGAGSVTSVKGQYIGGITGQYSETKFTNGTLEATNTYTERNKCNNINAQIQVSGAGSSGKWVGGLYGHFTTNAINIKISGQTVKAKTIQGGINVGGLYGYLSATNAKSISIDTASTVDVTNINGYTYVGGLIGEIQNTCSEAGNITLGSGLVVGKVAGNASVGGLFGKMEFSKAMTFKADKTEVPTNNTISLACNIGDRIGSTDEIGVSKLGGFFGSIETKVKFDENVKLVFNGNITINNGDSGNPSTKSVQYVGGFTGFINSYDSQTGTIDFSAWTDSDQHSISVRNVTGAVQDVGGAIGYTESSNYTYDLKIGNYENTLEHNITISADTSVTNVGGVLGRTSVTIVSAINNASKLNITGRTLSSIGGVTGFNTSNGTVTTARNYADITLTSVISSTAAQNVGGLFGNIEFAITSHEVINYGNITINSTNGGSVTNIGGLIGSSTKTISSESGTVINAYKAEKNITISHGTGTGNITSVKNVGGIVGSATQSVTGASGRTITNAATIIINDTNTVENVGGIVGYATGSAYTLANERSVSCKVNINIGSTDKNVGTAKNIGGLIGQTSGNIGSTGTMINSASIQIYATTTNCVGGIVGYSSASGTIIAPSITNVTNYDDYLYLNYFNITINGIGSNIGGIAGESKGAITSAENKNSISATSSTNVGGIAGTAAIISNSNVVGEILTMDTFSPVNILGATNVGGIVGKITGNINGCSVGSYGNISQIGNNASVNVGGIAGYATSSSIGGSISNDINLLGNTYTVGGLVGYLDVSSNITISGTHYETFTVGTVETEFAVGDANHNKTTGTTVFNQFVTTYNNKWTLTISDSSSNSGLYYQSKFQKVIGKSNVGSAATNPFHSSYGLTDNDKIVYRINSTGDNVFKYKDGSNNYYYQLDTSHVYPVSMEVPNYSSIIAIGYKDGQSYGAAVYHEFSFNNYIVDVVDRQYTNPWGTYANGADTSKAISIITKNDPNNIQLSGYEQIKTGATAPFGNLILHKIFDDPYGEQINQIEYLEIQNLIKTYNYNNKGPENSRYKIDISDETLQNPLLGYSYNNAAYAYSEVFWRDDDRVYRFNEVSRSVILRPENIEANKLILYRSIYSENGTVYDTRFEAWNTSKMGLYLTGSIQMQYKYGIFSGNKNIVQKLKELLYILKSDMIDLTTGNIKTGAVGIDNDTRMAEYLNIDLNVK